MKFGPSDKRILAGIVLLIALALANWLGVFG